MIDMTYGELVDSLRKDLQLDPATDLLGGVLIATVQGAVIRYGRAGFGGNGTSAVTGLTIAHGLRKLPAWYTVMLGGGLSAPIGFVTGNVSEAAAPDTTNLHVQASATSGFTFASGTNYGLIWAVIG